MFLYVCSTSLLKTLGKGEIARSIFYPFGKISSFHNVQNCCLQTLSVWKSRKFAVWEKVNPSPPKPQLDKSFLHIYMHFNTLKKKALGKHCGKR